MWIFMKTTDTGLCNSEPAAVYFQRQSWFSVLEGLKENGTRLRASGPGGR